MNDIVHKVYNKIPEDQDVRDRALNPAQSFIVQAPAGAGKTELLVNRFLSLLSVVDEPEEILAITFTRKAADEMTVRVMERLKTAQVNPGELTKEVYGLCQKVLQRDKEKNWNLLLNANRLSIKTIDAFCLQLVAQLPWLTQLGNAPKLSDNPEILYEQAVTETFDMALNRQQSAVLDDSNAQKLNDAVQVLLKFNNFNLSLLQKSLSQMLSKRSQWLPVLMQSADMNSFKEQLEWVWHQQISAEIKLLHQYFEPHLSSALLESAKFAATNLQSADKDHPLCIFADDQAQLPGNLVDDVEKWQALAFLFLTDKNLIRGRLTVKEGFPPKAANCQDHKDTVMNVCEWLKVNTTASRQLALVRKLPPVNYSDPAWQTIEASFTLLRYAAARLLLVFKETNEVDYSEITHRVIDALRDYDASGNQQSLAYRLDYQLKHILIDEFQDTSDEQLSLLSLLTKEWQRDDNRSLFLVGDPMQSIYRFRAANVSGFSKIFDKGIVNIDLQALTLTTNFRSSASIVEWVNEHFQHVFPTGKLTDAMVETGAIAYAPSVPFNENFAHSGVEQFVIDEPHAQKEAIDVVERIQDAIDRDCKTIAILTRNKKRVTQIVHELHENKYAFSNIEINPINTFPCIIDYAALCRAIIHFADDIAWTALLRAPWCGLSMAAITQIFEQVNVKPGATAIQTHSVWQKIENAVQTAVLADEEHQRLQHLYDSMKQWLFRYDLSITDRATRALFSLYGVQSVDALYQNGLLKETHVKNLRLFISALVKREDAALLQSAEDISDCLESLHAVETQQHTAASGKQIQIEVMTIHKSKGLQFDHVILPGLSKSGKVNNNDLIQWLPVPKSHLPADLQNEYTFYLISGPSDEKTNDVTKRRSYLSAKHKEAETYEEMRLLYVACTRAVKSLDLFYYDWRSYANSYLEILEPALKRTRKGQEIFEGLDGKQNRSGDKWQSVSNALERLPAERIRQLNKIHETASSPVMQEPTGKRRLPYQWAGLNARLFGTLLHDYLFHVAEKQVVIGHVDDVLLQSWRNAFIQNGLSASDSETQLQRLQKHIETMGNDSTLQWILHDNHLQSKNEWAMSLLSTDETTGATALQKLIIDRTFIAQAENEPPVRWIIDYKTSVHQGGNIGAFLQNEKKRYQPAMEQYARAIHAYDIRQAALSGNTIGYTGIKLGLYFPLIGEFIEWKWKDEQLTLS